MKNTEENTESEYFERTKASLLYCEQNNMIKEKAKNKCGKYNKNYKIPPKNYVKSIKDQKIK